MKFIQKQMPGIELDEAEFADGDWTTKLEALLDLAPVKHNNTNGADQISKFIEDLL